MAESHQGLEKTGREKMRDVGAPQGRRQPLSLQERDHLSNEDSVS